MGHSFILGECFPPLLGLGRCRAAPIPVLLTDVLGEQG